MEKFYVFITKKVSSSNKKDLIIQISSFLSKILFVFYPLLLLYLFFSSNSSFMEVLLKPLIAFTICTTIRFIYNRPRPFQKYNITPLYIHKEGRSFPSRHTTSAMIIAFVTFIISPIIGVFMIIIALLIAISRIVAGVHFISDIIAGILLSYIVFII